MTQKQIFWAISAERGLDASALAQAQALAGEVQRFDGVELKLDWEFAAERVPNQASNFCCRADDKMVGYALLEGDGTELEVTAAVSPLFRRQGIATALFQAVQEEAVQRGASRLLLVSYRASESGAAAVRTLGLPYISSEYRMEAAAEALPPSNAELLHLVQVDAVNSSVLAQMTETIFGHVSTALPERLQQEGSRYFLAELEGVQVGQIGVVATEDSVYIRGVGVLPEYRRRGYGRRLLGAIMQKMLAEGQTRFMLDVATDNPQALAIYEACGFQETTIYDYYEVSLAKRA